MNLAIFNKESLELKLALERYVSGFDYSDILEKRPSMQTRRLASLAMARHILLEFYGMDFKQVMDIQILRHESGEPYLQMPGAEELHVSISHSGHWFACVISSRHEKTCIDIEDKQLIRRWNSVAKHYFAANEYDFVKREGISGFYKLWTTKEALAKLAGKGLTQALQTHMDDDFYAQDLVYENSSFRLEHSQTDEYYYTLATQK